MKTRTLVGLATFLLVPACAGSAGGGVSDSEVDAIKTARESLTIADEFTSTSVAPMHVRLAWGYLSWMGEGGRGAKGQPGLSVPKVMPEGFDWTGNATVTDGKATLDMSTFLEKGDSAEAGEANEVKWNSHTFPHFDGVIATLEPATTAASLVIKTPSFEKTVALSELTGGKELRFDVEATGRQFSISSLPEEDAACSGFVVGFSRVDGTTTHFKGLRLSKLGDRLGKLRFDVTDGAITAEVVDASGAVIDSGEGTLDAASHTFAIKLGTGSVSGLYVDPSYSSRGSFQATARCP